MTDEVMLGKGTGGTRVGTSGKPRRQHRGRAGEEHYAWRQGPDQATLGIRTSVARGGEGHTVFIVTIPIFIWLELPYLHAASQKKPEPRGSLARWQQNGK